MLTSRNISPLFRTFPMSELIRNHTCLGILLYLFQVLQNETKAVQNVFPGWTVHQLGELYNFIAVFNEFGALEQLLCFFVCNAKAPVAYPRPHNLCSIGIGTRVSGIFSNSDS